MLTPWGESLDRLHPLQEYPRPQLRRESYLNLNGPWDYAITPTADAPLRYDGQIIVPFSPESQLSGVGHTLLPTETLWYHRRVTLPEGFRKARLLVHFGAVDQIATVYANGTELCTHVGGYTPFTVDLTDAVQSDSFDLTLRVTDLSDSSHMTRGKQKLKPGGIWHSAQSGIWQTVWMESVPENYIRGLRIIPHFDEQKLELWVAGEGECHAEFGGESFDFPAGKPAVLPVADMHPWSPEAPYLYDLYLRLGTDEVDSYFAMRKFSVAPDAEGNLRLTLNGVPYFQTGLIDQGYWSDGMLTAPSDEALIFDIELAKRMGFNLLRKHMKIEPLRWYYHCDRLGMLVWQDMPAGGSKYDPFAIADPQLTGLRFRDNGYAPFGRKSEESRTQYLRELHEMITALFNCPCVAMWVPFNEGWGQFDTAQVCAHILRTDASRWIDPSSGWHDRGLGFIRSLHSFSRTFRIKSSPTKRALILSAFGGCGLRIDGHCHGEKTVGNQVFGSANSFKFALRDLFHNQILAAKEDGLSAAVYQQLSDVEDELTGLVTYDRKVIKLSPDLMRGITRI